MIFSFVITLGIVNNIAFSIPYQTVCPCLYKPVVIYTAKNATTDVMQAVDFTGLMQFANKLYQAC